MPLLIKLTYKWNPYLEFLIQNGEDQNIQIQNQASNSLFFRYDFSYEELCYVSAAQDEFLFQTRNWWENITE